MTPRPWTKSFETGHPVLDQQHQALLGMLDGLEDRVGEKNGEKAFAICKAFRTLMEKHFNDEEDVLDQADFPELPSHMQEHAQAREQIDKIINDCGEACKHGNAGPCLEKLTHHMLDHIIGDDLGFKSHLQSKKMAADRR